jgi:hypothetical protein
VLRGVVLSSILFQCAFLSSSVSIAVTELASDTTFLVSILYISIAL